MLYSKADCGLCAEAEQHLLRRFGARQLRIVDIIGNRDLEDQYVFRVPVVVYEGQVVAEGQIGAAEARAALRRARQLDARGGATR